MFRSFLHHLNIWPILRRYVAILITTCITLAQTERLIRQFSSVYVSFMLWVSWASKIPVETDRDTERERDRERDREVERHRE